MESPDLPKQIQIATGGTPISLGLDAVGGPATATMASVLSSGAHLVSYAWLSGLPIHVPQGEHTNYPKSKKQLNTPSVVARFYWISTTQTSAMFYSISTLLTRNLHDVFGENDPARRRAAIEEIFTEDCVFYDPTKSVYRGRDEIDRVAGAIRATHPDFRYQPITEPEELGNGGRIQWVSGPPGEAPAYAGTDFIIVRDGRIAAVYLFFDKLP